MLLSEHTTSAGPSTHGYVFDLIKSTDSSTELPTNSTTVVPPSRANIMKSILLTVLLIITLLTGLAPFTLFRAAIQARPEGRRQKYALVFTLLSVYGGGVFLATCLLDLLPDSIEEVADGLDSLKIDIGDFPLAQFLIAVGFFLVLFMEQFIMWLREMGYLSSQPTDDDEDVESLTEETASTTIVASRHWSLGENDVSQRTPSVASTSIAVISEDNIHGSMTIPAPIQNGEHHDHDESAGGHGHSHDVHFDPRSHSTVRAVLLVFALSLHSIFEGLALGLIPTADRALQVFLALSIHKALISFSLGMRLVQSSLRSISIILCCITFAIVSPLGGFAGLMIIDVSSEKNATMISGCLTAVACGTFLYVTCFEILPHELNEPSNRLAKLIALLCGFGTIVLFIIVLPD